VIDMRMLAVLVAGWLAAGCACAYGGPGCGEPGILGLCSPELPLGETAATVTFFDDTGPKPSEYGLVVAVPPDRLAARLGDATGALVLVGLAEGPAEFRISRVEGWEAAATFFYSIDVVAAPTDACDRETTYLLPDEQ
jgi:hypothetical protein